MFFNVVLCIGPVFIVVFYSYNKQKWESEEFLQTYGTILEEFKMENSVLFYPCFFMIRRALLAIVARFAFNNVFL